MHGKLLEYVAGRHGFAKKNWANQLAVPVEALRALLVQTPLANKFLLAEIAALGYMLKVAYVWNRKDRGLVMQNDVNGAVAKVRLAWERPALRKMQAADARHFTKTLKHGDLNHYNS